jgi:hypothetical protein
MADAASLVLAVQNRLNPIRAPFGVPATKERDPTNGACIQVGRHSSEHVGRFHALGAKADTDDAPANPA